MKEHKGLRGLPAVDKVLRDPRLADYYSTMPRDMIRLAVRQQLEQWRKKLGSTKDMDSYDDTLFFRQLLHQLNSLERGAIHRVINATGIIVHTNLGRSVFSKSVLEQAMRVLQHYTNLEYDVRHGKRSSRYDHLNFLFQQLTGYEASLVVNNNAAAVLLVLDTFAKGGEVVLSRSELVEIGGGFRIPEVMEKAGVLLVEVGCTNKTRIEDFERAITENTRMLTKVHRSNFHISGFTAEPSLEELSHLAAKNRLPFLFDLGSGNILPQGVLTLESEPHISECLRKGVSLVTFSGDKLLGGPQAGIILGSKEYIDKMKQNQLLRALRVDKVCLLLLEATLRAYLDKGDTLAQKVPTVRMMTMPLNTIQKRLRGFKNTLQSKLPDHCELQIQKGFSEVGGGSLPGRKIPTKLLGVKCGHMSAVSLEGRLRQWEPPIIARIQDEWVLFDFRTISIGEQKELSEALISICSSP